MEKINTEETCSKYAVYANFNGIPREGKPEIHIKPYMDQCHKHMIRNGMWDVLSLPYPHNKDKKWDILLHQSIFTLDYVKRYVQSLQKRSGVDQYVVQNLT